jgi:hypothetical protein
MRVFTGKHRISRASKGFSSRMPHDWCGTYTRGPASDLGETGAKSRIKCGCGFHPCGPGLKSLEVSRNRIRDPNSPSGSAKPNRPRLALPPLHWLPRLIQPGSQRRRSPARRRIGRVNEVNRDFRQSTPREMNSLLGVLFLVLSISSCCRRPLNFKYVLSPVSNLLAGVIEVLTNGLLVFG